MKKLLFFTSLFISFNFFGQLNLDWFTQMDQTSGSYFLNECTVYGIAESPVDGSVYVVGVFRGTVDFNPYGAGGDITSFGSPTPGEDPFIVKYNSSGVFQWVNKISNPFNPSGDQSNDRALSVVVDNSGFVYVHGDMYDGGLSSFLARYTSAGAQSYILDIEGYSTSRNVRSITVDNLGYIYVFDRFTGTADLNPGGGVDNHTAAGGYDAYIAKFNASTGAYQWGKSFGNTNYESAQEIQYDGGYVYVIGAFQGTVDFDPNGGVQNRTSVSASNVSAFIARYSSSTGAFNYAELIGHPSENVRPRGLEIVGTDMYVKYQYAGTVDFQPGVGTLNLTGVRGASLEGGSLVKYNKNTLSAAWGYETRIFVNDGSYLDANSSGVMISGDAYDTDDVDPTGGVHILKPAGVSTSLALVNFNTNGTFNWAYAPVEGEYIWNPAILDNSNGIYVGGNFSSDLYLDPNNPTTVTMNVGTYDRDGYLAHYTLCTSGTNTTSTAAICENQTKALTSTSTGGSWSIVSGGGSISGTTYTPANVSSNTNVTVRYTDGCGNTSDRTFTVNVYNIASNTTSTASICETGTKTLVGSPSGGTWSIISGGGSISGTTYTPANVTSNTSVTVRYTIPANGACPATTSDRTFTVNVYNVASNTTSTAAICETGTKTLVGSPSGGTWSIISGGGSISGTTYTPPNVTSNTSVTVRYTIPANGACAATTSDRTFTVNVYEVASNTTSTAAICETGTKTLVGSPSGGTWSIMSGGGSISGTTYTPANVASNTSVTVRYTIAANGGCSATTSDRTFTVNNTNTAINSTSTATICENQTKSLNSVGPSGTWSIISGGGSISGSTYTPANISTQTSVTIRLTVAANGACPGDFDDVTFLVDPILSPSITSSSADICSGATRALTATPSGGSWSVTSGPGSISGSTLTATGTGTIQIQYSVTNTCGTYTASQSITSVGSLSPSITSSGADLCNGSTRALTGTPSGGSWTVLSGPGSISGSTLTATGIGTIQIRYSVTNACGTYTTTQNITTVGALSPSITSSGADLCNGSTRALTGTPSGGSWTVVSGPGSISGSTLTATGVGTVQIRYTVSNACGSYNTTQNITTVNIASPSITSSSADICSGATRALTGTPSGGTWSVTSGPGSISGSTLTATGTGTIQVSYIVTNACGPAGASQNITSVGALSPSITSSGADLCNGSTRALTGTPSGGSWTVVSGPGSISGSTLTATGVGTVQIRYTVTNACGSYNTTQNITTVGTVSPSVTSSGADICSGATRALTATPSGGSWSVTSGPGSISGSTLTATGTGTIQIQYSYTNACGTYTASQSITSVGVLSPSITSSSADICSGATRALTGTPSGGSWSVTSGPGSITGSTLTATGTGTIQIQYSVTNACGTYTANQSITSVGALSPSITSSSADICNGNSRALTATPSGGSWSVTSGPGSITGTTLTATGTGTIQIQYSVTNACGTYTDNQSITVVDPVTPSITSSSADICNGSTRALTATPSGGSWNVTSGPGSISGSTLTATGTGTIQIQYSYTNACGTYTANQSITSVDVLSPNITSSTADICNGNSRALTATPSGGTWSVTSGPGSISGNTLTATGTGTIQVQYSVTNACGSYTDNQSITAVGPLAPAVTSSNADLCSGSSRALTGTPSGGTWSVLSGPGSVSGSSLTCSGVGTITIQYSVTNVCGTYTTTQNITGVDVLSPSITSSNSDMCIGDNRSLTGTPSGGTWSITSGGTFGNISGGNQLNATATGTITVQYSVTNACGTYTTTQNINVVSTVTPAITSSVANMCVGDKRQLTASPGGGNWTVLSGPGSIGPSDTLTATGSGTIQIRYSVSSSCGTGSDTVNITVNPVPTATITSSNSTFCVGSSRALTGTPVGGVWSVVSGPGSITGSTLTSLSSGTIVIEYAVTQSGCTGTTTQTINVVDSSNATWTSPGTVCENAGLTNLNTYLAPFATTGGVWSGHPSVTAVGILDPTGLAGTTLNIKYKVGTAPCQDSLTLTINIQNNVDPTWTNPTAICENAGLTDLNTYLSGSATTGGVWSGHPSVTAGGILNPTGLAGSSLTIKYKVGTSPCVDSMSHTFTINPASSGAWTNPVTVCENSPIIDLNTLITGNTGGTWAGTNVTVGGLFNPSGLSGSIAITYMVGTAPCADTVTQNVTVNPAADASWSIPTTICESQMFDLDTLLLPSATSGGIWSGPGVTGSIFDPFGLTAPVTIKYVVGTLGCADSLSITISTIAPSPGTPVVSLTVDTTCAGDTTTIMATGSGSPVVYNIWTASSGGTFLGQAPLTVNPSVTTTYYVEAIAPNLCPNIGGRQSIEVVVNPLPTANAGVDENICYGDSVTLVASGGGTYVWSNSTAGANNTVNPITTTNYIVYVTSTTGCTDSDTVTVNVQTTGSANAQDDAYSLTTGTLESIDVYSNDAGSVSTIMIVGGPFNGTATVGTGGVIDYISTLGYIGMDSLYYQICDPSCTLICDTAKLVIEVQNDLTIPTGMSPNNDGKNDFFNILGIEKYPDNELYVYNRWGDIVYQAVPYNNDWSGESINAILGDKVVEGTYFYILKLGTDLPTYKGYIEVKK